MALLSDPSEYAVIYSIVSEVMQGISLVLPPVESQLHLKGTIMRKLPEL